MKELGNEVIGSEKFLLKTLSIAFRKEELIIFSRKKCSTVTKRSHGLLEIAMGILFLLENKHGDFIGF